MKACAFAAIAAPLFAASVCHGALIRVEGSKGDTIQAAADRANPGDTVLVAPGVYYESVAIRRFGLEGLPVTFRAEKPGETVVTRARRDIREGKTRWRLEDERTRLFSISCEGSDYPARVLYGGTDLYPYASIDGLRRFVVAKEMSKGVTREVAGPRHGYYYDTAEKKLYVRLHAGEVYGPDDPNRHVMCVAPEPDGVGYGNFTPTVDSQSCFRVLCGAEDRRSAPSGWPAFVSIEGFILETPSLAGVFTDASGVVVSNCCFRGCRLGVSGDGHFDRINYYRRCANNVRVTKCDYTQFPAYEDGVELLGAATSRVDRLFWHRKHANEGLPGKRFIYESGIIGWAALDWEVDYCRISSCFEGISAKGATMSEGLKVHDCIFERMLDNAIEFEDSAQNVSFYRNLVRDVFSPVSWQPLRGRPLPGPCYVYCNVFVNSPSHLEAFGFRKPSVFKIMGPEFGKVASPGVVIFNNTIWWPGGGPVFGGAAVWHHPDRIAFVNNLVAADHCFSIGMNEPEPCPAFRIAGNVTGAFDPDVFAHRVMAGRGGLPLENAGMLKLAAPENGDFALAPGSPASGRGGRIPGTDFHYPDAGAPALCAEREVGFSGGKEAVWK